MNSPLEASRAFAGRLLNAERQRAEIELERRVRPLSAFSAAEGVLGLLTLRSALSRKSWFSYLMGVALLSVACGHAFLDLQERKMLDLLSGRLSR